MIKFFLDIVEHERQRSAAMHERNSDINIVQVKRQFSSFCRKNIGETTIMFLKNKGSPKVCITLALGQMLIIKYGSLKIPM